MSHTEAESYSNHLETMIRRIELLIEEHRIYDLAKLLIEIEPPDIVDIIERLENDIRRKVISILPLEHVATVLVKFSDEVLYEIAVTRGVSELARILVDVPPDDVADILQRLPPRIRSQILSLLPPWKSEEVINLMKYPPESAGGIMTPRIPIFNARERISKVIEKYTAKYQLGLYDKHNYIYAVDENGHFIGWIDVRTLLVAPREKVLQEVVSRPPVTAYVYSDREEVAKLVVKYDLLEVPVVDEGNRLLGAITLDDLLDVMVAELTEDLLKFGGYSETIKGRYLGAKVLELAKRRAPWLIALYLLETFTVTVINSFSNVIAHAAILAAFLPLLIATGGNVGSQAATLVIRSLAIGEARFRDLGKVLFKEFRTSLLLASILAPLGFTIAFTIAQSLSIALAVSIALITIVVAASLIGSLLPFIALFLRVDPAVVSSPFLSTICDVTGALVYFTIASYIVYSFS